MGSGIDKDMEYGRDFTISPFTFHKKQRGRPKGSKDKIKRNKEGYVKRWQNLNTKKGATIETGKS
jgi:hypothetical protein